MNQELESLIQQSNLVFIILHISESLIEKRASEMMTKTSQDLHSQEEKILSLIANTKVDMDEKNAKNMENFQDLDKKILTVASSMEEKMCKVTGDQIKIVEEKVLSAVEELRENMVDMTAELEKDKEEQNKIIKVLGKDLSIMFDF